MRQEIMVRINSEKYLKQYLQKHPIWYRKLMRNPTELNKFEINALNYFQITIPHKTERIASGVQMASLLLGALQANK